MRHETQPSPAGARPGWFSRLLVVPFLFLPLYPAAFAAIAVVLGLVNIRRERPRFVVQAAVFGVLGAVGQVLAPVYPPWLDQIPPWPSPASEATNLMPSWGLEGLGCWHPGAQTPDRAQRLSDGFYRLRHVNPENQAPCAEALVDRWYPLTPGVAYTQSFYLRHNGTTADFQISFVTHLGHNVVDTRRVDLGGSWVRVYGAYTARSGDRGVRAVNIVGLRGDWTYLDLGYAQLERGGRPASFNVPNPPGSPLSRAGWWLGTALLVVLVLHGARFLLGRVKTKAVAVALLAGLVLHGLIGLFQLFSGEARAVGLTPQANFLGHGAVMSAGLLWLIGSPPLAGAGVLAGLLGVWVSGSRAALLALLPLGVWWWLGLPLRLRLLSALGAVSFGLTAALSGMGGRLANLLDPSFWLAESRLQVWSVATRAFLEQPLFGIGWGNFTVYYQLNLPAAPIDPQALHTHSLLLQILAEAGLAGLISFAVLFGAMLVGALRVRAYSVAALFAAAMVLSLFDFTWFFAGVLYPLVVALAWGLRDSPSAPDRMNR